MHETHLENRSKTAKYEFLEWRKTSGKERKGMKERAKRGGLIRQIYKHFAFILIIIYGQRSVCTRVNNSKIQNLRLQQRSSSGGERLKNSSVNPNTQITTFIFLEVFVY